MNVFRRLVWAGLGVFGVTLLVVVWRYQPPKLVVSQAPVPVKTVATPTPGTSATGPKPTNTPGAGGGPTPTPTGTAGIPSPSPGTKTTPTPTPGPGRTPTTTPISTQTPNQGPYHNGTYTGSTYQAVGYGPVQVQVVISGGYITDVVFAHMPGGPYQSHTDYAEPILKSETLQAQSANINTVSGATQDSDAYKSSLSSALSQA